QAFGDFPILKNTLKDNHEELTAASNRRPRNKEARFILSDLDSAITPLKDVSRSGTNRSTTNETSLIKSNVAIHKTTWLKYHKGTAQVPGGPNWPGTGKIDNFSINIDSEIDFFLTQAMEASARVADAITLANNIKDDGYNSSNNPYAAMFASTSMGSY